MHVNLNFWKYKGDVHLDDNRVYVTACCEGDEVDGLDRLPITEILNKLKTEFSSWTFVAPDTFDGGAHGSFNIFMTSQAIRFDCYDMSHNDINLLRNVMLDFDCPFYDPLLSFRFVEHSEPMSEEFCFWKYKEGIYLDNRQVYETACCEGKAVDGLEQLPITDIMNKLKTEFSSWTFVAPDTFDGDKCGSFRVFMTSQAVRLNCCGMSGYDMNLLMDMMSDFNCPVYDPKEAVRFDEES